jgi:hypothetical protein
MANGYLDVKSHSWFADSGIKFSKLLKKKLEAPWKPQVKDPLKLSSTFDDYSVDEVDEASRRKLTVYEQEMFRDF